MATIIPSLGACKGKMEPGEKRFAQRLEKELNDSTICWFDVPIGRGSLHPDFVILDPSRGLLIVEVKDWKVDTIESADPIWFRIRTKNGTRAVDSPLEQARQYAHAVTDILRADAELRQPQGTHVGGLRFPWTYGVAFTHITRRQFKEIGLDKIIEESRTICQDEITETVAENDFRNRLWQALPFHIPEPLSSAQIDRIRWRLFPEIRIPKKQLNLFEDKEGDVMLVMDLQQEQLARNLGEGHRVIHGVAGSGKTLILAYRALRLAPSLTKPILILCYNKTLSKKLDRVIRERDLNRKVHVSTFHKWCLSLLSRRHLKIPPQTNDKSAWSTEMVARTSQAVAEGKIPKGQYGAILVDEGHDFEPDWWRLVVEMVDSSTNSLLVLFDDAQSIYAKEDRRKFSFKSVGIQAPGRTTILRVNYRNTQEILDLARDMAQDLLRSKDSDEDGVPLISPIGSGRHGPEPIVVKLKNLKEEANYIAERFREANKDGMPWQDMAVIYYDYKTVGSHILRTLRSMKIPVTYYTNATFSAAEDTVKFLTMHSCKGLEFPLVAIPGVGSLGGQDRRGEADTRLLYVAMTRATQELLVCDGSGAT